MRVLRASLFFAVFLSFLSAPAYGGWVAEDSNGTKTLFSGGKARHSPKGELQMYFIFDSSEEEIIYVDPEGKLFSAGSPEEYCRAYTDSVAKLQRRIKERIVELPPEERALAEDDIKRKLGEKKGGLPAVEIEALGSGGTIAGFETLRYRVVVNGRAFEELWLSEDPGLAKNLAPLREMGLKMSRSCNPEGPSAVRESPEYLRLRDSGWPLRVMADRGQGLETVVEIVKLKEEEIPEGSFSPPPGYEETLVHEMMERMMGLSPRQ